MVGQGKTPRFNWNDAARVDLLVSIVRHANPTQEQWVDIIEDTSAKGYPFNANAAQQHLMKLRKKDDLKTGKTVEKLDTSRTDYEMAMQEAAYAASGNSGSARPAAGNGGRRAKRGPYKKRGATSFKQGPNKGNADFDDVPSEDDADVDNEGDIAPPPAKKARKSRATAKAKLESAIARNIKTSNSSDEADADDKEHGPPATAANSPVDSGMTVISAIDYGVPSHANWAAERLASTQPFSHYGRATTQAPNPAWVPQVPNTNFFAPAASAYQSAHNFTGGPTQATLLDQSNYNVDTTTHSSVGNQSRAHTEAPNPAFSDSFEAPSEDEA